MFLRLQHRLVSAGVSNDPLSYLPLTGLAGVSCHFSNSQSAVQRTSRSASSASINSMSAFERSGSASASSRYRIARAWFFVLTIAIQSEKMERRMYADLVNLFLLK